MIKARTLRALLDRDGVVVAPCAYDALSARCVEVAGFEMAATTGFGMHGTMLGVPDNGLMTFTEMMAACYNMASAVSIPLMADAEGGYGNAINTRRTVREFEKAGVAGLFIEDQVLPPNCPYIKGTRQIPVAEMVAKIQAACDARKNPDTVIVARTDAPFAESVDRLQAYAEAGADMVKPMPRSRQELERFPAAVSHPMHLGFTAGQETTRGLTWRQAGDLGYKVVTFPFSQLFASARALLLVLQEIKDHGTDEAFFDRMVSFQEYLKLVDIDTFMALDEKYMFHID
ncbi:MAG: isocitrate lyase/PEP mutase family protein [Dermatophilaceae bacterium]